MAISTPSLRKGRNNFERGPPVGRHTRSFPGRTTLRMHGDGDPRSPRTRRKSFRNGSDQQLVAFPSSSSGGDERGDPAVGMLRG